MIATWSLRRRSSPAHLDAVAVGQAQVEQDQVDGGAASAAATVPVWSTS